MITITLAQTEDDLQGILALQQQNLVRHLPAHVQADQGFVTLEYTLAQMKAMHALGPSVIAKDREQIVGYAITSAPEARAFIPELASLFDQIDAVSYKGQSLHKYAYYVMGQVCVANGYRGQGLFDRMYQHHRQCFGSRYQLLITDISARNLRSMRAHERVGFQPVHQFHEPGADETWILVVWDWEPA